MTYKEALELFMVDFKKEVVVLFGVVYFSIAMYWVVALRDQLFIKWFGDPGDRNWSIVSLLFGLTYAGFAGAEWGLAAAGTALTIGLCISIALMNSTAAACLLASSLYLRPWELADNDPYLSILPRFSIVLCLAHLALYYAKQKKIVFEWNSLSKGIVAFTVWVFLSTLFSDDPGASQGEFFDGFIKSVLLYFILIQMIRTTHAFKTLLGTLLFSFLFVGMVSLYQTMQMSGAIPEADNRLKGFGAFTNSNDIAALMAFILPFSVIISLRKQEGKLLRIMAVVLSFVGLAAIVLSRSRGALLGVMAFIAIYGLIRIGRKAIIPLAAACALLALPAMVMVSARRAEDLEGSSEGRITYFKAGIRMGTRNPIFGVGFDRFPDQLQTYSTESLEESKKMTAHNSWVLVFAETGIPGLILFSIIFGTALAFAWKVFPTQPEFLLALVGYGVSIFFLSHSYLIYPYLLFALVHLAHRLKMKKVIQA